MIHEEKDVNGSETGKERITIPAFDLYGKEVDDGNRRERITTHAYEIRASPKTAEMFKNLLCKISNEGNTNLKPISYGINVVLKKELNTILLFNIIFSSKTWQ